MANKPDLADPQLNTGWAHYANIHAACPLMNDQVLELGPAGAVPVISIPDAPYTAMEWANGDAGFGTQRGLRRTATSDPPLQGDDPDTYNDNRFEYDGLLPQSPGTLIVIYEMTGNAPSNNSVMATGSTFNLTRANSGQQVQTTVRNVGGTSGAGDVGVTSGQYLTTTGGADKVAILTWDASNRAFYQSGFNDGNGDPVDAYGGDGAAPGTGSHGLIYLLSNSSGNNGLTNCILLGVLSLNVKLTQAQAKAIIADPWGWIDDGSPPANQAPTFNGPNIASLNGVEGTAITSVDISGRFSDPDGNPLTFSQDDPPSSGAWPARSGGGSWISAAGVISGTPAAGAAASSPYLNLRAKASDGSLIALSNLFAFTVNAPSGSLPDITGVSANAVHGSSMVITGANLATATAVNLKYSTVSTAQAFTESGGALTIASVASNLTLPYGSVTLEVITPSGADTITIQHLPPAGKGFVNVDVPWSNDADSVFEGSPNTAAVDGDQIEYDLVTNYGAAVTVFPDGTARVEAADRPHTFNVRIWDESAKEWGT